MSDYLVHHGIEGQRWGVRNGPPYPLSRKKNRKRIDGIKTGIGPIQTIKTLKEIIVTTRDKNKWIRLEGKPEQLNQLKRKHFQTTLEEDLQVTNPFKKKDGGTWNCANCAINMEMRRRGYDTVARRNDVGIFTSEMDKFFYIDDNEPMEFALGDQRKREKDPDGYKKYYDKKLVKELSNYGTGARGYLSIKYQDEDAGHALFWEVENGKVKICDPQSGKTDASNVLLLADPDYYTWIRLDNKRIKPEITTMIRSNREVKK